MTPTEPSTVGADGFGQDAGLEVAMRHPGRWALILAGGEGTRLRPLTRRIAGDERPKQFCPFVDGETLLDRTRRRVALSVRPERTRVILTRSHEAFYAPLLADMPARSLIVQPGGRGTGPAILYGLLRVAETGPRDFVVVVPSDHYVSDDACFMAHVDAAFATVEDHPDLIVLLGIAASTPETGYGWIEGGERIADGPSYAVYRVRRFWEKPAPMIARKLLRRGCLWNSFVLVARVPALLDLIRAAVPEVHRAFVAAWRRRASVGESAAMRTLYDELTPTDFSREVLGARPADLAVLPVRGVAWSDWGEPERVLRTLARLGIRPAWSGSPATVAAGA